MTGVGSILAIHPTAKPIASIADLAGSDPRLLELLFLDLLDRGYYIAARGYLALSLVLTQDQLDGFAAAVEAAITEPDRALELTRRAGRGS